jgi:DNA-binding transcriptional ArsR family regulator
MAKYLLFSLVITLFYRNIAIYKYTDRMGVSKTEFFTDQQNELASLFKAIAHPARIAIIEYLLKVDTCICGDIVNELPLAQPTVSQHLKELKNVNIIKGNIEGTAICYCLNPETMSKIEQYFHLFSKQLQSKCCS